MIHTHTQSHIQNFNIFGSIRDPVKIYKQNNYAQILLFKCMINNEKIEYVMPNSFHPYKCEITECKQTEVGCSNAFQFLIASRVSEKQ